MGSKRSGKPRYTAEVHETICRHLRVGAYLTHAAEAAGVSVDAAKDWVAKGLAGDRRYEAFAHEVRRLQAEDVMRLQSLVTRAALGGDWKAASWLLERKFPKWFGHAASAAATALTVRGASAASGGDERQTQVTFYLPSNGRRPDEGDDGEGT